MKAEVGNLNNLLLRDADYEIKINNRVSPDDGEKTFQIEITHFYDDRKNKRNAYFSTLAHAINWLNYQYKDTKFRTQGGVPEQVGSEFGN